MPKNTAGNNLPTDLSVLSSYCSKRHQMFQNDNFHDFKFQKCEKVTQSDGVGAGDAQTLSFVYWPQVILPQNPSVMPKT
jgi:hypothetical protein